MCRWMAYSGDPLLLEDLLYKPAHSLIDQSRHARMGVETMNGDGFGVGWYSEAAHPAVFRGVGPAWSDRNLRSLAAEVKSPLFMAHIRASTGTPVQETNCHPFRFQDWLWMHNGGINEFATIKRELVLAVDPELYPHIEGSTDSELMFFLALTYDLRDDPVGAVERMVGHVESVAAQHNVPNAMQMTVATTNGNKLWAFRYSTERNSRSLYYSTDVSTLRKLHPDNPALQKVSDEARLIVSEPLGDLPGAWNAVPESMWGVIEEGDDTMAPFRPTPPRA